MINKEQKEKPASYVFFDSFMQSNHVGHKTLENGFSVHREFQSDGFCDLNLYLVTLRYGHEILLSGLMGAPEKDILVGYLSFNRSWFHARLPPGQSPSVKSVDEMKSYLNVGVKMANDLLAYLNVSKSEGRFICQDEEITFVSKSNDELTTEFAKADSMQVVLMQMVKKKDHSKFYHEVVDVNRYDENDNVMYCGTFYLGA